MKKCNLFISITMILLTSNCMWVRYSKETIDRPSIDLTPLSESLLVLPDSNYNNSEPMILFQLQKNWSFDLFESASREPFLTYRVDQDGWFSITFDAVPEKRNFTMGTIDRAEIQNLIYNLNKSGFFNIGKERRLYDYYDVKRTYCFGFLVETDSEIVRYYPRTDIYHLDFGLKHFRYEVDYYGIEGDIRKLVPYQELQILKDGVDLIDSFFESKIKTFSERPQSFCDTLGCSIISNEELDEKLRMIEPPRTEDVLLEVPDADYTVVVKLLVGPNGDILYGMIMESGGNYFFDYKVLDSAMKYNFTPPMYHGRPVCVWVAMPIKFKIK